MIRNGFKRRGDDDPENSSPLAYFHRNNGVYKFCKSKKGEPSKPLSEFINSQRQKFTAHTIRQPNSRHTKQLLFNDDKYHRTGNHSGPLLQQVAASRNIDKSQFIREEPEVLTRLGISLWKPPRSRLQKTSCRIID